MFYSTWSWGITSFYIQIISLPSWRGCWHYNRLSMTIWLIFQKEMHFPTEYSWKQQLHRARRGTKSCQSPRADRLDRNQGQHSANPCCDLVADALWGRHQKTAHCKYGILSTQKCLFHWSWKLQICVVRNPFSHRNSFLREDFQITLLLVCDNTRYSSFKTYKASNYCNFFATYSSLLCFGTRRILLKYLWRVKHTKLFFKEQNITSNS